MPPFAAQRDERRAVSAPCVTSSVQRCARSPQPPRWEGCAASTGPGPDLRSGPPGMVHVEQALGRSRGIADRLAPSSCLRSLVPIQCRSPRHTQGSFHWIYHLQIELRAWVEPAQFIVKTLSHHLGMTKDTARDAHWNGELLVPWKKMLDHSSRQLAKFLSRSFQSVLRNAILAGNRCWKQCGKVRGWNGIGTARQLQ